MKKGYLFYYVADSISRLSANEPLCNLLPKADYLQKEQNKKRLPGYWPAPGWAYSDR